MIINSKKNIIHSGNKDIKNISAARIRRNYKDIGEVLYNKITTFLIWQEPRFGKVSSAVNIYCKEVFKTTDTQTILTIIDREDKLNELGI